MGFAILQEMSEEKRSFYRKGYKQRGTVLPDAREWAAGRIWLPRLLRLSGFPMMLGGIAWGAVTVVWMFQNQGENGCTGHS